MKILININTMEKKFNHEKFEVCKFCKKEIDTEQHQWICVNGYDKQENKECWFAHVYCFNDVVIKQGDALNYRVQNNIMDIVKNLLPGISTPIEN